MESSRKRDLVILMLKFLGEMNFKKTLHMLEQESGIFFNMKYFEEKVVGGEWDEVEKYVSGFTDVHDNRNSTNIYFEIRKQKFLEAIERQEKAKAFDILVNELEVISQYNQDMYKELTRLLHINNFKVSGLLSEYMKERSLINLKMFIQDNDRFAGKLSLPIIEPSSRLTTLFNQSLLNPRLNHVRIHDDENAALNKVAGLLYTNQGSGLLVLGSNGILKLWKSIQNPGKIRLYKPKSGLLMKNNVSNVNLQEAVPCLALTKNDSYVVSAIGGELSLFSMVTSEVLTTFMAPPPASTFFAFNPKDYNIMAIGLEDSTILIYNVKMREVISTLRGHQKRVTGLAFSTRLNILVSSAADAQLCEWNLDSWIKEKSVPLPLLAEKASSTSVSVDTRVQFNSESSIRLLVSNENLLAIYDSSKTVLLCQWVPQDHLSAPISSAVYSCNGVTVYASFCDGNIGVFDAETLTPRWGVSLAVYASSTGLNESVYPLVIATHPHDEYQLAIGMSDGSIQVFSINGGGGDGEWLPPTTGSSASCLDVVQRP